MMSSMSNGRVTTREFYDALIKMDRRLGDKIDGIHSELAAGNTKFDSMEKRIDENSSEIKKVRNLNTGIALLASTIAGIIGVNR